MLGPVPRSVEHLQAHLADLNRLPIFEGPVGVLDARGLVYAYFDPALRQLTVPRYVIRVIVRLDDVAYAHPLLVGRLQVACDVPLRVDDHAFTRVCIADEIGRTA